MAITYTKPSELTAATSVGASDVLVKDDGTNVEKATPQQIVDAGRPIASEAEAIAGTSNTKGMTPLTTKQAIDAAASDYATAAQGDKADSAVQPGDLATVATSGDYDDLSNTPTLGTAAAADTGDFATAAQGALADTATQPGDLGTAAAEDIQTSAIDSTSGRILKMHSTTQGPFGLGGIIVPPTDGDVNSFSNKTQFLGGGPGSFPAPLDSTAAFGINVQRTGGASGQCLQILTDDNTEGVYARSSWSGSWSDLKLLQFAPSEGQFEDDDKNKLDSVSEIYAEAYVSDNTGASDVATEFASFMAALVDGPMGVATGTYRLDSLANVDMDGDAPGEHLSLRGAGVNKSTILVNSSAGGIKFTGTGTAKRQHTVSLSGLQVYPGQNDSGIGIEIEGSAGGVTYQPCCVLKDIGLGGITDGGTETFTTPLSITGVNRPVLDNIWIYQHLTATTKWDKAIDLDGCYGPFIRNVWINCRGSGGTGGGALVGLSSVGTNEEGIIVNNFTCNGADVGVDFERTSREPGFYWSKGLIDHRHIGFRLNGVKDAVFDFPAVYSQVPIVPDDETTDFLIEDANDVSIFYPTFRGVGYDAGSGSRKRHFHLEPKSGKAGALVKNIHIYLNEGSMSGESIIPPIYCNGATNVTIHLPKDVEAFDFASYPEQLVEIGPSQDPDEIHIVYDEGGVAKYDDTSNAGPDFEIDRFSSSPADNDQLGRIRWYGRNDAGEKVEYARISSQATDVTDATEDSALDIYAQSGGTVTRLGSFFRPAANGDTAMFILHLKGGVPTFQRVQVGAADSGGTGLRALVVPN